MVIYGLLEGPHGWVAIHLSALARCMSHDGLEHDDILFTFNGMGSEGMSQTMGCHLFNAERSGLGYKFFQVILGGSYGKPVAFLGDEQGIKPSALQSLLR